MRGEEYKSKAEYERAQAEEDYLEYAGRRFGLPIETLPHSFRRSTPALPPTNERWFEGRRVILRQPLKEKTPIEIAAKSPEEDRIKLEEVRRKAI